MTLDALFTADAEPAAFALLHRSQATAGHVDLLTGDSFTVAALADLPLPTGDLAGSRHELVALLPYRQLAERGFSCPDDGAPLLVMRVTTQHTVEVATLLQRLPDEPLTLRNAGFTIDDRAYAEIVRTVLDEEIGSGRGANFVIERPFTAEIIGYTRRAALSIFRRLLARERGAYWTYLVHIGGRTFVGASPERHVSVDRGAVVMNPISGTYRYPLSGPTVPQVLDFLADRKEIEELHMVVDEELKMMGRVCDSGGQVVGPFLKTMTKLAHTEYLIEGHSSRDVRDVLRETMFAPTVTGSPLESACRVINRYEPDGRRYYSGVLALIGRDGAGERTLDSAIVIRTAEIDAGGRMRIGVGASLVRQSDPDTEVAETHTKVAGLLAAVQGGQAQAAARPGSEVGLARDPLVSATLAERNALLAPFWLHRPGPRARAGRSVLLIDAEDSFTSMLGLQLAALGLTPVIRDYRAFAGQEDQAMSELAEHDLVLVGPGPGDPRDGQDPKIAALRLITRRLLGGTRPFLSVCLGHQVLSSLLGLELVRVSEPQQGRQRVIDLFGQRRRLGFYNSFSALSAATAPAARSTLCADRGSARCSSIPSPCSAPMASTFWATWSPRLFQRSAQPSHRMTVTEGKQIMTKLIVSNQRTEEMIGDLGDLTPEYRRYVAGQAQRMVWLADPGDVMVLPVPLDEDFLTYVAALKGIERSSWTVVVPPAGRLGPDVLSRDRLENETFLAELRAVVRQHHVQTLLPFHFDRVCVRMARDLELAAATPGFAFAAQGGTALVNSKATFRALAVGDGVPVPYGTVVEDPAEAEEFIWALLSTGRPVIIKQDFHVGGLGNEILSPVPGVRPIGATSTTVITDRSALTTCLDERWSHYSEGRRSRVVIEHYTPESLAIYAELLIADEGVKLVGHGEMRMKPVINGLIVPAPSAGLAGFEAFLDHSRRLCETVRRAGYRGSISIDAIVTPDEDILVNEFNGRVVGSAHIHRIGEELVGPGYATERVLIEKRRVAFPDFRVTLDKLTASSLAFDPLRGEGVVVTVHDNGRDGGFGGCCIVAADEPAARVLENQLDDLFGGSDG